MGLSFTDDGRYIGWSNLFDLYSLKTLEASEKLPQPKNRRYAFKKGQTDVTKDIKTIQQIETQLETDSQNETLRIAKINAYNTLIRKLNKLENTHIIKNKQGKNVVCYSVYWDVKGGREILNNVERHEKTNIPMSLREKVDKNFISSHIQGTVQNLRNMIAAYSPINMDDLQDASSDVPKSKQASSLTLFNPAAKWIMQRQNIVGKDVIGIAANGEKISFMWHYWINDQISKAKSDDDLKYISFDFNLNRLNGRYNGNPTPTTINTLPEVNPENLYNELSEEAKYIFTYNKLTGNITVDLMISQILSAATDNAKELILDKINCGSNFANMYLFLVTLGFDIKDIVKFMTSPVVTFIDSLTSSNIFINKDISVEDALNIANGIFGVEFREKFLSESTVEGIIDRINTIIKENKINPFKDGSELFTAAQAILKGIGNEEDFEQMVYDAINSGNIEDFIIDIFRNDKGEIEDDDFYGHINFTNYKRAILQIKSLRKFNPKDKNIQQDIAEFIKIREGAQEFTNMASLLGINQGIKTSKTDIQLFINKVQNAYSTRIKKNKDKYKKLSEEFKQLDFYRFLTDNQYKKQIIDIYDKNKVCLNIFALIDQIPQYKALYELFGVVLNMDKNIAIKSQIFDDAYNKLKKKGYNKISESYYKGLLSGIDNLLISTFFKYNVGSEIPYKAGTIIQNEYQRDVTTTQDGIINFTKQGDLASFKAYFENTLIPGLKNGIIYDYDKNREVKEIKILGLKDNRFIQSLIRGRDGAMPYYKCNLDLLSAKNTDVSKRQLQIITKGLSELSTYKINGTKISDLFMMYNLIVNKNQYGSDRMTTLFENFLENSTKKNNIIYKYLNWVGSLDFKKDKHANYKEIINYSLEDLMLVASRITQYRSNWTDPSYIYQTSDNKLEFYTKQGKTYKKSTWNLITPLSTDKIEGERLQRVKNYMAYWTLGGSFNEYILESMEQFKKLNSNTLSVLSDFIKKGILTIQKNCN